MPDGFASHSSGLNSPASQAFAVTPHATNELTRVARGLFIGTGGHVTAILANDTVAVVFKNVPSGSILPIRARIVHTDTTATDIVALT